MGSQNDGRDAAERPSQTAPERDKAANCLAKNAYLLQSENSAQKRVPAASRAS